MTNLNPFFAWTNASFGVVPQTEKLQTSEFFVKVFRSTIHWWKDSIAVHRIQRMNAISSVQNSMHHCGAHRLAYHRHLRLEELARQNRPDVAFVFSPRSLSTLPAATSFHITTFFYTQCLTGCWNLSQLSLVKAGLHPGWVAILLSRTERESLSSLTS